VIRAYVVVELSESRQRAFHQVAGGVVDAVCVRAPRRPSQDRIWFQLALFWSTISKSLILNA
jgi:hypothetical protein